jgi:hypothetical protein
MYCAFITEPICQVEMSILKTVTPWNIPYIDLTEGNAHTHIYVVEGSCTIEHIMCIPNGANFPVRDAQIEGSCSIEHYILL